MKPTMWRGDTGLLCFVFESIRVLDFESLRVGERGIIIIIDIGELERFGRSLRLSQMLDIVGNTAKKLRIARRKPCNRGPYTLAQ